jgi:hypothetical protein
MTQQVVSSPNRLTGGMLIGVGERFAFQEIGGWTVEMTWREGDYQGGPAGMWIRPTDTDSPPQGGLSSTVLRQIDFRKAKDNLVKDLEARPHGWRGTPDQQRARDAERVERIRYQLAKGISPEYLALLASNYILRVNSGQPKPVESLADDLGKPLQTIRGHLWRARKDGLLSGSAGRKGGDLTVKAMTILQQMPKPAPQPQQAMSLIYDDPPAGMEDDRDR